MSNYLNINPETKNLGCSQITPKQQDKVQEEVWIPNEVMNHIFLFLGTDSLTNTILVDKRWNQLTTNDIFLKGFIENKNKAELGASFSNDDRSLVALLNTFKGWESKIIKFKQKVEANKPSWSSYKRSITDVLPSPEKDSLFTKTNMLPNDLNICLLAVASDYRYIRYVPPTVDGYYEKILLPTLLKAGSDKFVWRYLPKEMLTLESRCYSVLGDHINMGLVPGIKHEDLLKLDLTRYKEQPTVSSKLFSDSYLKGFSTLCDYAKENAEVMEILKHALNNDDLYKGDNALDNKKEVIARFERLTKAAVKNRDDIKSGAYRPTYDYQKYGYSVKFL